MAEHARGLLVQHGIPCMLRNVNLSGAAGELPPTECWPEVWVLDDADLEEASRFLETALQPDTTTGPAWRCRCGELLEAQFTSCWQCGRERDAAHD